jgi:hypothetical protein
MIIYLDCNDLAVLLNLSYFDINPIDVWTKRKQYIYLHILLQNFIKELNKDAP